MIVRNRIASVVVFVYFGNTPDLYWFKNVILQVHTVCVCLYHFRI